MEGGNTEEIHFPPYNVDDDQFISEGNEFMVEDEELDILEEGLNDSNKELHNLDEEWL